MRAELVIESGEPPVGTVCVRGGPAVGFTGWLELLAVLSALGTCAGAASGESDGDQPTERQWT